MVEQQTLIPLYPQVPHIDACEAEVHVLLKERADRILTQRQQVLDDVLDELLQQAPGGRLLSQRPRVPSDGVDEFGYVLTATCPGSW